MYFATVRLKVESVNIPGEDRSNTLAKSRNEHTWRRDWSGASVVIPASGREFFGIHIKIKIFSRGGGAVAV